MLSFEDDTPMAAPTLGLQMIHSTPSGRTSPAEEPAKTAPPPDKVPVPTGHTRVRAEDKRVINARTDVNQLVPFK
ncbi:MAG: ribonucleotide-diphosphate reductase subunit beta, partial [Usitatibacter sp.]